jgi:hypothetical protein
MSSWTGTAGNEYMKSLSWGSLKAHASVFHYPSLFLPISDSHQSRIFNAQLFTVKIFQDSRNQSTLIYQAGADWSIMQVDEDQKPTAPAPAPAQDFEESGCAEDKGLNFQCTQIKQLSTIEYKMNPDIYKRVLSEL